jgi:peptidylprolyl isomerase
MSMSTKERGILLGLAIVLAAATAWIVIQSREQGGAAGPGGAGRGQGFDERRLPDLGPPLRTFETPGGVKVQVLKEGTGEPVGAGQAMDVAYVGYHGASGAIFERGTYPSLVLARGGVIAGWLEGLEGIKAHEKRRLFIPSAMAYGARGQGNIRPNSDLVFDVEWVRLETKDLKVGDGKEARRGSRALLHYKGELENGFVFDASYKHTPPDPMWFPLKRGAVIDGFAQGAVGMKVGGQRRIEIPYHLGYGEKGSKPAVPPYANLIFTVELLDVE